jgi:hypothetical protein
MQIDFAFDSYRAMIRAVLNSLDVYSGGIKGILGVRCPPLVSGSLHVLCNIGCVNCIAARSRHHAGAPAMPLPTRDRSDKGLQKPKASETPYV